MNLACPSTRCMVCYDDANLFTGRVSITGCLSPGWSAHKFLDSLPLPLPSHHDSSLQTDPNLSRLTSPVILSKILNWRDREEINVESLQQEVCIVQYYEDKKYRVQYTDAPTLSHRSKLQDNFLIVGREFIRYHKVFVIILLLFDLDQPQTAGSRNCCLDIETFTNRILSLRFL